LICTKASIWLTHQRLN